MESMARTSRRKAYDHALLVANLLLFAYIVHLLLANYVSQNEIRRSTSARIAHETSREAEAIGDFLAERRRDIVQLAEAPEVTAYFDNRSLGMSLQYGLRATLVQAQKHFGSLLCERTATGLPTFTRLILADAEGHVLVENETVRAGGEETLPLGGPASGSEPRWSDRDPPDSIVMSIPVERKGRGVGHLIAWVAVPPIFARMHAGRSERLEDWIGLYEGARVIFSPDAGQRPPPAVDERPLSEQAEGERLFCAAPVPGTPFRLGVAYPAGRVLGRTRPWQQLIGVGAVAAVLLFVLIGYLRHVEHKRMDREVRESEERLSRALEATNDGVWDWDMRTNDVYFSPRWTSMLGYRPDEIRGRVESWATLVHPDDMPHVSQALDRHLRGAAPDYESEHRCRTAAGAWKWILDRGKIIERDEAGKPVRMIGTHTDISARKETERLLEETNRHLEERVRERSAMLLQSEKMASIGQLAAGVAHEINNPAGFVNGNLDTLQRYVDGLLELLEAQERALAGLHAPAVEALAALRERIRLDYLREDIRPLLAESLDGMRRIARIVADLKDFSHEAPDGDMAPQSLNELIEKAVSVAWNELKYKCELIREFADLPPVPCNGGQISQVILNLLVNAAQAIEGRGSIRLRTELVGGAVRLSVRDDGPGIPEAILTRIFDPFFTTKPVGKGTGLGLHICQRIITAHGGSIQAVSPEGGGAEFVVLLPLAAPGSPA